jgi:TatD DNase family protein
MRLVDSHCHLDMLQSKDSDLDAILQRASANGVGHILNVCVNLNDFQQVLKTAQLYPFVSASVGMHPNEEPQTAIHIDELNQFAQQEKVIAIGETGLDYFRSQGDLTWQRDRFRLHIQLAKKYKKPLIIHMRDAAEDTLKIMREENARDIGGIMHCFTEDWTIAQQALDLGFYISFSGIVTFKNAVSMQETAKKVPLDKMLIETDAPYLAPEPFRGKPNEPSYVKHTAEFLANLKQVSLEEFGEQTTRNFFDLFKLV